MFNSAERERESKSSLENKAKPELRQEDRQTVSVLQNFINRHKQMQESNVH